MNTDSELDHDALIRNLIAAVPCGVCDHTFDEEDIHLVSQEGDDYWVLIAVCHHCGTESLIFAQMDWEDDEETLRIDVGVQPQNEMSLLDMFQAVDDSLPPITEAEVTAWRHFLITYTGDLDELLRM